MSSVSKTRNWHKLLSARERRQNDKAINESEERAFLIVEDHSLREKKERRTMRPSLLTTQIVIV